MRAMGGERQFADIERTLKRATAALRDAGVPFLLGGSLESWARGGPETRHDLDLIVKEEHAERGGGGARAPERLAVREALLRAGGGAGNRSRGPACRGRQPRGCGRPAGRVDARLLSSAGRGSRGAASLAALDPVPLGTDRVL